MPCFHLNFRPVQFSLVFLFSMVILSLVCLCVYWCSLKLGWSAACVCVCPYIFVSLKCQCVSEGCDLLFIQNPQATFSKYATCLSVLFFALWDVKLLRNLSILCLLVQQAQPLPRLSLPSVLFFPPFGIFFFFRDSLTISLEIFHQIAGEYITPKLVARRGKITMPLKSVHISQQQRSCHLLTICQVSCGGEHHPSLLYTLYSVKYYDWKQTVCMVWHTGYFGDLWNVANKHKRPNLSVLLDIRRNQSNVT